MQLYEFLFEGQIFLDCDGEELEIINISGSIATMQSNSDGMIVAPLDAIAQDLQSGDLVEVVDD